MILSNLLPIREANMKKLIYIALAAVMLLLANSVPSEARHGHFSGGVFIGVPLWGPGWWGYPYPYAYPYPYPSQPTVVIRQEPQEYVQQPAQPQQQYWYYCPDPQGYYPYVKACPKGWLKVVPTGPPEMGVQ
jgi:hypothetical protein